MERIKKIRETALTTIRQEADAITTLLSAIDDNFICCVNEILDAKGRVIVTGIGKSAIIGQKIVATFNSTGTPAIFMHAADAIHGDLGIIQKGDVVLCISKSGETPEIKILVPLIKKNGNILMAMVGNSSSYLAVQANYTIDTSVPQEACPNNLAPTSSTTAQLVMGDALAVSLLECRGFTASDFAKFHPGGILGKKLYLTVEDLYVKNPAPQVNDSDNIKTVIMEISSKRLGATAVLKQQKLIGIITDGDLRRMLEKNIRLEDVTAEGIMSKNPKTIKPDMLVIDALQLMRNNNITQLIVQQDDNYLGIIHLHDILKEGII
ncbi:MAG: KpsF/GutQ family sugar-phosphate isomerase [Bacteroidales bacterium]|nr:KpsF/GutQ family sugar-phosphate isomerase [Bacteroidales bacterium]